MERVPKKRKENPDSCISSYPTLEGSNSNTTSYLLEQIGILKAKNQNILEEHQNTLRKYEDTLAEKDQQLATLRSELSSSCKRSYKVNEDTGVARLGWNPEPGCEQEKRRLLVVERELSQSCKALEDQTRTSSELQKQLDVAKRKIEDMVTTATNDKTEIKSLKLKLDAINQDKAKFQPYQKEIDLLKKNIRQLENKRKTDIHDLTTKFEMETKKYASQTKQWDTSQGTLRAQLQTAEEHLRTSRQELELITKNEKQSRSDLQAAREELVNVRELTGRITEAYGQLKKRSVSSDKFEKLENAYLTSRIRFFRTERRLADRDTVIEHLSALCKQLAEDNLVLKTLVEDLEFEKPMTSFYQPLNDSYDMVLATDMLKMADLQIADLRGENHLKQSEIDCLVSLRDLYQAHSSNTLDSYIISDVEASRLSKLQEHLIVQHGRLMQNLAEVTADKDRVLDRLSLSSKQNEESRIKCMEQRRQLTTMEVTMQKHSKNIQRLTQTLFQNQNDKSQFQEEISRLSYDLEDALRYKEAHADLLSEVIALIQRNELAEAEAERLSRFNTEILSHKNPQQRIYYVDKIRTELAETKHELLRSTQEQKVLAANTASLQNELAAYKSILIPIEQKPAGSRIHVRRARLEPPDTNKQSPE